MTAGVRKMKLLGVAAVAILAFSGAGCSSLPTIPDWVDPTTWFGGDSAADNGETPDLAGLPDKPGTPAADETQKVAESLATDRNNAKYSAEALKGGNEPAAAPPPDAPVKPKAVEEAAAPVKKAAAAPQAAPAAPVVDRSVAQDPTGVAAVGTLPATAPGVAAPVAALPPPAPVAATPVAAAPVKAVAPAAAAVETAALAEPAPAPKAAVKAVSKKIAKADIAPVTPRAAAPQAAAAMAPVSTVSPSDAELGFKPSSAPPLDPSVSQFVSAPIVNRYRQTTVSGAAVPAKAAKKAKAVAMGGPENMSGSVVANPDAAHSTSAQSGFVASANGASATVYFPGDGVSLNAVSKAEVRSAVDAFKARGGQGFIRVVGHASSRTPNMAAEKHTEFVFKKSQDRANAVAQEIIREGIPADKVLVEAVGDTQPIYYESMPKGEEGNRRAEIFLQS